MNLAIFDAEKAPVRGLRTRWAAYATGLGFWSLLSNVRWGEDGSIRVRFGSELKTSGTIGGASDFKGFWAGTVNGTWMALAAVRAGGTTTIYKSTDMVTWTATTTAAGYESAGFSTDGWVYFDVIKHPEISESTNSTGAEFKDIVVAQNGSDYPRVSDSAVANFYVHRPVTAPSKIRTSTVVMAPNGYFNVKDNATTTPSSSGGGITVADTAAAPNSTIQATITAAVANGDNATMLSSDCSITMDMNEVWMIVDTSYTEWLGKIKIEIGDNTDWMVVHDPSDAQAWTAPYSYAISATKTFLVFGAPKADGTGTANRLRLTWVAPTNEAPGANKTVDFYLIVGSSSIFPGGTVFGVATYNAKTFAMSPGVIYKQTLGDYCKNWGGTVDSNARIPVIAQAKYAAYMPFVNLSTTERDRGAVYSLFFAQEPEDYDLRLRMAWPFATYAPSAWSYATGAAGTTNNTVMGGLTVNTLQPRLPFPTAFHIPIPKGTAMEKANNHFFVGAAIGSGVAPGAYFSRLDFDTHFMEIPDLNLEDYSPGSAIMASESVQAITAVNTNIYQNSIVYVHTNRNLYAFAGTGLTDLSKIGRVANSGTLSPRSVVVHKSALYWLDHEAQFRRLKTGYEVENLSRLAVDDKLKEIPASRRDDVVCAAHGDRIYIGYTPTGDTKNVSILVFNTVMDEWESIDDLPSSINAEAFVVKDESNVPKLYFAGQNCHVYEHEVDGRTQDLTTGSVAVDMRTGNLHDFMETPNGAFVFRNVQMVLDRGQTGAITVTRTYQPGGGTLAGTLTATSGSGIGWVEDVLGTATGVARGKACQLKFTGGLKGGSRIYAISAEVEDRDSNSTSS